MDVLHTNWNRNVKINVCSFVTSGRTANEVSPTRPRVTLFRASWLIGSLRDGATVGYGGQHSSTDINIRTRTWDQNTVHK